MTKAKTKGPDYGNVTPALIGQVREVIADGARHHYSVSKVYGAYNAVFGKKDTPQTCSSCLRNRVRELCKWLEGYEKHSENAAPQYDDPAAPGFIEPANGIVRYPMAEGIPFDFLPDEGTAVKGSVIRADGSKVRPGTYITAEGLKIVVQPGGRANIKEDPDDNHTNELL